MPSYLELEIRGLPLLSVSFKVPVSFTQKRVLETQVRHPLPCPSSLRTWIFTLSSYLSLLLGAISGICDIFLKLFLLQPHLQLLPLLTCQTTFLNQLHITKHCAQELHTGLISLATQFRLMVAFLSNQHKVLQEAY